jgi:CubicO group peptidase (beta-lactamase class C family)
VPLAAVVSQSARMQKDSAVARTAEGIFRKEPMPALSVAAYRGSVLAFAEAYGEVDLELGVTATTSHRFRVGSGAKPVTATLAAIMADEGIVSLDAGIGRYMPALPNAHHATTLRQLLTHRGGIRHYIARDSDRAAAGGAIDSRTYFSNADILAVFIDDPLIAVPGTKMTYSTFGYTLASIVLEEAAGTPFVELLQQKIAAPLGLASLTVDAPRRVIPWRASGYGRASQVREVPPVSGVWANAPANNPAYKWAGGGLVMTPCDFARFGAAHLAPGVLSRRVLDTLLTVQVPDSSPPLGLGWRINRDSKGRLRWHHAGGQEGARSIRISSYRSPSPPTRPELRVTCSRRPSCSPTRCDIRDSRRGPRPADCGCVRPFDCHRGGAHMTRRSTVQKARGDSKIWWTRTSRVGTKSASG